MDTKLVTLAEKDAVGKYFLSDRQIEVIIEQVLKIFPIPEVLRSVIQIILVKVIKKIDEELYKLLPNEVYDFINYKEKGFSPEELKEIKKRLIDKINKLIDLPFLSERQERELITLILNIIIDALGIGKAIK